jgi:hypothetical protein
MIDNVENDINNPDQMNTNGINKIMNHIEGLSFMVVKDATNQNKSLEIETIISSLTKLQ